MTNCFEMTGHVRDRGAILSPDRRYRYRLWRTWDPAIPPVVYIMLNPSVADETQDDPTIVRCVERARRLGAGGIVVTNLFAYVSTDSGALSTVADPVGPDNDAVLVDICRSAMHVVCGWGARKIARERAGQVLALLRTHRIQPKAVRVTRDGSPGHLLYVPYEQPLLDIPEGPGAS